MTSTSTPNNLLLAARIVGQRQHEREQYLAELRDDAEVTGSTTAYRQACLDAGEEMADDLLLLLRRIEECTYGAPGSVDDVAAARRRSPIAAAARIGDGDAAAPWFEDEIGDGGDEFDRVCDGARDDDAWDGGDDDPADCDDDADGDGDGDRDCDADPDGDELWGDAAPEEPVTAAEAIDAWLAAVTTKQPRSGTRATVSLRMPVDSVEYRDMLHPRPGQLTLAGGSAGDLPGSFYLALSDLLNEALDEQAPRFVCLALPSGDDPDTATVVSGWTVGMSGSGADEMIDFEDGSAVAYYDLVAIKVGSRDACG